MFFVLLLPVLEIGHSVSVFCAVLALCASYPWDRSGIQEAWKKKPDLSRHLDKSHFPMWVHQVQRICCRALFFSELFWDFPKHVPFFCAVWFLDSDIWVSVRC